MNKTTRELCNEFFKMVEKRSAYKGWEEVNYGYIAGYLESFISRVAHLPEVQEMMNDNLRDYKNCTFVSK